MPFPSSNLFRKLHSGLRSDSGPSPLNYPTPHYVDGEADKQSLRHNEGVPGIVQGIYVRRRMTYVLEIIDI